MSHLPPSRRRMLLVPYVGIRHCQTSHKLSLGDGHGQRLEITGRSFRVVRRRATGGNEHVSLDQGYTCNRRITPIDNSNCNAELPRAVAKSCQVVAAVLRVFRSRVVAPNRLSCLFCTVIAITAGAGIRTYERLYRSPWTLEIADGTLTQ